jgi:outer membrane protein assembly factor BamE (lipoprotein component of BamABCDE complex)
MAMKNNRFLLLTCALMLSACTPTVAERGNMLEDYQLKNVTAGTHTRSDVLRLLGSPTTQAPFDENTWYYIGQETEKRGILDPEITKERVVVVKFGEDGIVEYLKELPKDSRVDVPIARNKTATKGNDFTFMQQLLGNMGKFNKSERDTSRTAGGI